MNIAIKQNGVNLFLKIAIVVVIIKIAWIAASFFLPKNGIDKISFETKNFYDKYRVSKAFGLIGSAVDVSLSSDSLPIYKLDNMKLQGVYISKEQSFIAVRDGESTEIISKKEVFKGYLLDEVLPLKAIFIKDGAKYEISLEEEPAKQPAKADVMGDDVVRFVSKPQIQKYTQDVRNIWKSISIDELVEQGKLEGFRVTKIDPSSVFGKLGLQVGDVIVGANNKRFVSYSDVLNLYKEINNIDNLKLTFIRDKQEKELEYEIY